MRLDEISKAQFVDKLGRQWIGNIEDRLARFKKYINTMGWDVEWHVADDAKSISVEATMADENTKSTAEWIKRLFWDYIAETGDDGIVEIQGIHETDKILIWNIELMRLDEITKEEFVDKLKDPIQFKIKDSVKRLRDILDESEKFKMSKIEYITHSGRDIIKFTVFFPQSYKVDYPDEVRALEQIVFDPFRDIIDTKMSDAIYVRTGGRPKITFMYYLK